ncbi:hypothetical protein BH09PLA1_BH09PLA1_13570 [soil metagenome]
MLNRFIARLVIAGDVALGAITAGCIAVGGTDNYTQPTLGRQLQDLKLARDTGAISDAEYSDARAKLISCDYLRKR